MLTTLCTPVRVKEAATLEMRIAQCEAARDLADGKKVQSCATSVLRGYLNVLSEHRSDFPEIVMVRITARLSTEMLRSCVQEKDPGKACQTLRLWTRLLFPWADGTGVEVVPLLMDPLCPSFRPIVDKMVGKECEAGARL